MASKTLPLVSEILDQLELIRRLPPAPWCVYASSLVPTGCSFRQWDTNGRLIVWVNATDIHALPRRDIPPMISNLVPALGVPIVFVAEEDADA